MANFPDLCRSLSAPHWCTVSVADSRGDTPDAHPLIFRRKRFIGILIIYKMVLKVLYNYTGWPEWAKKVGHYV